MRIRQRLIGLLVGMLSLGAVVAMFPAGSEAAGNNAVTTKAAAGPLCDAAKQFVRDTKDLIGNRLPEPTRKEYNGKLAKVQSAACEREFSCEIVTNIIADLRALRGDLLSDIEAQLRELEDNFLQLACSS